MQRRVSLRGSFEDVCAAHEELRSRILEADWNEIEGLLDRAFCGYMPKSLERFLNLIRLLDLEDDPDIRRFMLKLVSGGRNMALRRSFELSGEYRIGHIREER